MKPCLMAFHGDAIRADLVEDVVIEEDDEVEDVNDVRGWTLIVSLPNDNDHERWFSTEAEARAAMKDFILEWMKFIDANFYPPGRRL